MKLHTDTNSIHRSNDFEENPFSIEASAKAFMILSDGLYSNKIQAVIRELSTNAYDSHVEAGYPEKPFEIHLPSRLEPYFYVRDFGTSMTHEQCMTLYTTYFRSTRNNSNEAIGCLGLGSKAPFAYTDHFTVEAILNGQKRIYSGYKSENGNPTFSLIESVSTNEPNGIKVSMSVNNDDIDMFHLEAKGVYKFFTTRPIVVNHDEYFSEINNDEEKLLSGKDNDWYFASARNQNLIIMGQISYPIDSSAIMSNDDNDNKIREFIYQSRGLRIFVNIGDLDITPSRESLSYTRQTKDNIRKLISGVIEQINSHIETEIKSQPSLYLARKKYIELENQCNSIKAAAKNLSSSLLWNDQKIFDNMVGYGVNSEDIANSLIHINKSSYRSKVITDHGAKTIFMRPETKFYIDDCNRGGIGRIRQSNKDRNNAYNCYVYKLQDGESISSCRILEVLGGAKESDLILTSSLPKIERKSSSSTYSGKDQGIIQFYNPNNGQIEQCSMSVKYENAVYIPFKKDSVIIQDRYFDMSDIINTLSSIYEDTDCDHTFYFISPSMIINRKLSQRTNWKGPEYLVEKIEYLGILYKENIYSMLHKHDISHTALHKAIMMTRTDNNAKKIVSEYIEYLSGINNEDKYKLNSIYNVYVNLRLPNIHRDRDFDNTAKYFDPLMDAIKKYPLIQEGLIRYHYEEHNQIIADYIDLVENSLSLTNA